MTSLDDFVMSSCNNDLGGANGYNIEHVYILDDQDTD